MAPALFKVNRLFATWFGLGLIPLAPGTFGTLGAIPLFYLLATQLDAMAYLAATVVFSALTILVAHIYELQSPGHDEPQFVMDEVAGFLVTMALVPATPMAMVVGFLVFRALDIVKPFPISYIDRKVQGGVGTVADDLVAGILGNVVMQLLLQNGVIL